MVDETARTCYQYLFASCCDDSEEHQVRTFYSLVLRGKLRTVAHCIIEREKGGVLQPRDACTKTREPILDVLHYKHPEVRATRLSASTPTLDNLKIWYLSI